MKLMYQDQEAGGGVTTHSFPDYKQQGFDADCNKLIKTGTYALHSNAYNAPVKNWGSLIVFAPSDGTLVVKQMFIYLDDDNNSCEYDRVGHPTGGRWGNWIKVI